MRLRDELWARCMRGRLGSLVLRTTLSIFAVVALLGIAFTAVVWRGIDEMEQHRAWQRMDELISTVDSTARIACFLRDRSLAQEIAAGLMSNRTVAGVRITAGEVTLAEDGRALPTPAQVSPSEIVTREVRSPFNGQQQVGRILLYIDADLVRAQGARYRTQAALLIAMMVTFVSGCVAFAVYYFVTQPISMLSNELHKSRSRAGTLLRTPRRNQFDEIGMLIADVNLLIRELTGLIASERELRLVHEVNELKVRLIFEKSATGLFVLDARGVLQSCNPAFARTLRLPLAALDELPGQPLVHLLAPVRDCVQQVIDHVRETGSESESDLCLGMDESGGEIWVELSLNPIGTGAMQGVVNDISERKRSEATAQSLAAHDALTGLLNRHGMDAALAAAFKRSAPHEIPPVALMEIDLDDFKQVNDAHGHPAGDVVLEHVARALERVVRRGDLIARPGGDEFLVALMGIASPAMAADLAERILDEIGMPVDVGAHVPASLGASIGIAFATSPADTPYSVLLRADAAMYAAKHAGGGNVRMAPAISLDEAGLAVSR